MRLVRLVLLLTFLAASLHAVVIKLSGDEDPPCGPPFVCVTGSAFTIGTNGAGGGFFDAVNATATTINQLSFDLNYLDSACPTGQPASVSLILQPTFLAFATSGLNVSSSSFCTRNQGVAEYLLGLTFSPGVPVGLRFQIGLNSDASTDPNGAGGWVPETDFTVITSTPEPSYALAAAGALLLMAGWRARRHRHQAKT